MDDGEHIGRVREVPAWHRAHAARALARAYLAAEADDEARTDMEAAITVLLEESSREVRLAFADALADSAHTPQHIVMALAADRPDIAELVLRRSPVLLDGELAQIVSGASEALRIAIASRPTVSPTLAAALAEVGECDVCYALITNPGATIAPISHRRIGERFGEDAKIREAMLGRADLPAEVHQLLVRKVGVLLGNLVVVKSWVDEERAEVVTREACDRATIAIAAETETEALPALVEHLRITGQLTTALLLRAVCAGNIDFFEAALAILAGVPERRVASLVGAGRPSALRAVYTRAGLPRLAFDAFAAALAAWREAPAVHEAADRYRLTRRIVETVIARYAGITDGEANELAAMLRRFAADQAREAARDYIRQAPAA